MIKEILRKLAMASTFAVVTYGGLTSFSPAVWAVLTGSLVTWVSLSA